MNRSISYDMQRVHARRGVHTDGENDDGDGDRLRAVLAAAPLRHRPRRPAAVHLAPPVRPSIWNFEHIQLVWIACHWLAMSSCCWNPIVYYWTNDTLRAGFTYAVASWCPCVGRILSTSVVLFRSWQVCRGYGDPHEDPHGYGYGLGMGIDIRSPRQPWVLVLLSKCLGDHFWTILIGLGNTGPGPGFIDLFSYIAASLFNKLTY